MASERSFDATVMERMLGGNRDLMLKFAGRFMASARDALAEIDLALGEGDVEQLQHLGHRTKSAALTVGAQEMAALCEQLERSGDAALAGPVVTALHAAFAAAAARMHDAGLT